MAILAGQNRYAHRTALRADTVNPQGLGMSRVCSEDSVRRAFADDAPALPWSALVLCGPVPAYEYQVLVTSLGEELLTVADLYRQRADVENVYDELKNQWGWGGFTTRDLRRCQVAARNVALVYN